MLKLHFSHRHPLSAAELAEDDSTICSGCELQLSGSAYKCTKPTCDFHLHDLCFNLPQEIHHSSHPKHPLSLVGAPPYADGEFCCNGCGDFGSGFIYHCPRCQFDLHIQCASLPESLVSKDRHEHLLNLYYCLPMNVKRDEKLRCGVCEEGFPNGFWVYYCGVCDFGVHVGCVIGDGDEVEGNDEKING